MSVCFACVGVCTLPACILGPQYYQLCAPALDTPAWSLTLEQEAFWGAFSVCALFLLNGFVFSQVRACSVEVLPLGCSSRCSSTE